MDYTPYDIVVTSDSCNAGYSAKTYGRKSIYYYSGFIVRFGASLTAVSDLGHLHNPSNDSSSKNKTNRTIGSTSSAINNPLRSLQEGRRKKYVLFYYACNQDILVLYGFNSTINPLNAQCVIFYT